MRSCDFHWSSRPQKMALSHIRTMRWPGTIFQIQQNNGRNECIVFTCRGARFRLALLLTKQWKSHVWKLFIFFIFACKKNMLERIFFTFRIFFKIIMKDKWFNILQTYKITSKIRHYFQKLVTCNEKPSFRELKPVVIRTFHSISLVK